MEILAIIPARGGSKGIKRKNIQPLAGKPLVAYSIEAAKGTLSVSRIVVSTDNKEIGEISSGFGADVIWRPESISGDTASSESALIHAVNYLAEHENYHPEVIVFLQCTSPLTLPEDIELTIQTLLVNKADSAFSASPFHYFLWGIDESGEATAINHDKNFRPRRQDRNPQFVETGAVYVMRTEGFIQARHRFFGKTVMHIMPAERRLEIDDLVDLEIAEVLIRAREEMGNGELLV